MEIIKNVLEIVKCAVVISVQVYIVINKIKNSKRGE